MNQSELQSSNNNVVGTPDDWDTETIITQIYRDLNGSVPLSTIEEVLDDVIPKYKSSRIQSFVPIFIRRDAIKQLRSMQEF